MLTLPNTPTHSVLAIQVSSSPPSSFISRVVTCQSRERLVLTNALSNCLEGFKGLVFLLSFFLLPSFVFANIQRLLPFLLFSDSMTNEFTSLLYFAAPLFLFHIPSLQGA